MKLSDYLISHKGKDAKGLQVIGFTGKPGTIDEIKWEWGTSFNDWDYERSWVHILWNDGSRSDQTVDLLDFVMVADAKP